MLKQAVKKKAKYQKFGKQKKTTADTCKTLPECDRRNIEKEVVEVVEVKRERRNK